jgi:hypothetical protein
MSSFFYGLITSKRAAAPPTQSLSTTAPVMNTYIDTLAGLVPAEALALYAGVVLPNATMTASVHGKKATTISDAGLLGWSCAGLLVLSLVLYLIGRYQDADYSLWDIPRALIPPAAFAAWMLVQRPGVFDVWWPDSGSAERNVIAAFAAVILGIAAKMLGNQADKAKARPRPSPATPADPVPNQ